MRFFSSSLGHRDDIVQISSWNNFRTSYNNLLRPFIEELDSIAHVTRNAAREARGGVEEVRTFFCLGQFSSLKIRERPRINNMLPQWADWREVAAERCRDATEYPSLN